MKHYKCERSPEDANHHEFADLQLEPGRPHQHHLQQHLQLRLHEEQVIKLSAMPSLHFQFIYILPDL